MAENEECVAEAGQDHEGHGDVPRRRKTPQGCRGLPALSRIAHSDPSFLKQYVDAAFRDLEMAIADLRKALESVSSRDYGRLQGRWRELSRRFDEKKLTALTTDIEASAAKRRARVEAKPAITLDESE